MKLQKNQKDQQMARNITNVLVFGKSGSSGYPVSQNQDGTLSRKVNCFGSAIHDINSTFKIVDGKPTGFPAGLPKSLQASWFFTWVSGLDLAANKLVPLAKTDAHFTPVKGVTIGGKPVAAVESTAYKAVMSQAQKWPSQLAVLLPNGNVADGLVRHPAMARHSHLELKGLPVPSQKPASAPKSAQKPAAKAAKINTPTAKASAPSVKPSKPAGKSAVKIAKKF